jgi:hypothetical protein
MTARTRGLLLLLLQTALVLSAAIRYQWERYTRPAVWVRVVPLGPNLPGKNTIGGEGHYGRVQLQVNACGLTTAQIETQQMYQHGKPANTAFSANIKTEVKNGKLIAVSAGKLQAADVQKAGWNSTHSCAEARLQQAVDVYLPPNIEVPYTLPDGTTLWALVTVPRSGLPRPIQLATSNAEGFHPLQ